MSTWNIVFSFHPCFLNLFYAYVHILLILLISGKMLCLPKVNCAPTLTIKLLWKSWVRIIHRSSCFVSLFQIETIIENETATLMPCLEDHPRMLVCIRPRLIFAACCSPPIIWTKPLLPCLLLSSPQLVSRVVKTAHSFWPVNRDQKDRLTG